VVEHVPQRQEGEFLSAVGGVGGGESRVHLCRESALCPGIVLGQQEVNGKSNEGTAFQPLLEPLDLKDAVVTVDALHTQREHATFLVEKKKAHHMRRWPPHVTATRRSFQDTIRHTRIRHHRPPPRHTPKILVKEQAQSWPCSG
jgi:hypothetical protein